MGMLEQMDKLINEYQMLPAGVSVLCAVSGGADSICLLHRLYHLRTQLNFRLCAAHYNHQLRGEESDRDEEFVREFLSLCCGSDRIADETILPAVELTVGCGDVSAQAAREKKGIEETARMMRYAFLQDTAKAVGAELIATAHTADDNAETVLIHLARGSGLRGLTGIPPVRDHFIRPLLTTSRQEVEDYLRYYGLPHIEDSSNASDAYTRNRIRHTIIPELERIIPGARVHIGQAAALLREDEACLSGQAGAILNLIQRKETDWLSVPVQPIAQAPDPVATRSVRRLLIYLGVGIADYTATHFRAVVELCRGDNPSARIDLPGGLAARREYESLILDRRPPPIPPKAIPLQLPGVTQFGGYRLTGTQERYRGQRQTKSEFYLSSQITDVTVRPRRAGDSLKRPKRKSKSIKKLLIDEKIPLLVRDVLPVLEVDGQVAGMALLGVDAKFAARFGKDCWHISIAQCEPDGSVEPVETSKAIEF